MWLPCVHLDRTYFGVSFLASGASLLPKFAREPGTQRAALDICHYVCVFERNRLGVSLFASGRLLYAKFAADQGTATA